MIDKSFTIDINRSNYEDNCSSSSSSFTAKDNSFIDIAQAKELPKIHLFSSYEHDFHLISNMNSGLRFYNF
jgi:hypothetical protein